MAENRETTAVDRGVHLTRAEAAKRAGCSVRFLEKLALQGGGPPFARLGTKCNYPLGELDDWLASRRVRSTSEATVRRQADAADRREAA